MARTRLIQAVFYSDPDIYPPIVNAARLLAKAGYSIDLICRASSETWNVGYPSGVHLRRLATGIGGSWSQYLRFVAKVLRLGSEKAQLFVGHDMRGFLPARLLASRYRRPLVYHCHDYVEGGPHLAPGSRLVHAFERRYARTAELVIVPDTDRGAFMSAELGLGKPPITVANSPISRPSATGQSLNRALYRHGADLDRVLFRQGRIGPGHSIAATLYSMPRWKSATWGFAVMGPRDDAYLDHLRSIAQSLDLCGRFVILPPVGYDEVAQFTPGAHLGHALYDPVHINHIHYTTASNKIMEYMAAGLPLLVSDTPTLSRLVRQHACGVTADQDQPESIAAAVNALFGDPERARRMGEAAARAFEQVFCYERQFAPLLDAVRSLASSSKGKTPARAKTL